MLVSSRLSWSTQAVNGVMSQFCSFDREYVGRLSDCDAATERHFVDYFSRLLQMKLRSRIRSAQDVDDLLQEVFLRVLRTIRHGAGLRHPERLGVYVNKVCDNVVFEYFRQHGRGRVTDLEFKESSLRSAEAGAEAELISEQNLRHVRAVVAELPVRDRKVLQAVFLEERDRDAVCREFGIRREHLRMLLHRAKIRFRDRVIADKTLVARSARKRPPLGAIDTGILAKPA